MKIDALLTDEALLEELGRRLTRLRLNQNITQADLAQKAGISKRTVERIEAGASSQLSNWIRIIRALGLVENFELLVPEPRPTPLEYLKLQGKERARASTVSEDEAPESWQWGNDT